jgi:NADH dehydrogenase
VVNECLEVQGWPGVWALGDCAVVPDARTGKPHPPTAQHALREGKVVAANVEAAVRGTGRRTPFTFTTLGLLAAIGRRTGVARILGVNFSGFVAWWLWRMIYLMKLPRLEKKLRVGLEWTLDLFFPKDIVQYLTPRATAIPNVNPIAAPPRHRYACDLPPRDDVAKWAGPAAHDASGVTGVDERGVPRSHVLSET